MFHLKYFISSLFYLILTGSLCLVSPFASAKDVLEDTVEINGFFDLSLSNLNSSRKGQPETETDTQNIYASAVYYVVDGFGLGLAWEYNATDELRDGQKTGITQNDIGAIAALNIGIIEAVNLKLIGSIASVSTEAESRGTVVRVDGYAWYAGTDVVLFATDSVAFNIGIRYAKSFQKNESVNIDVNSKGMTTSLGISVYLGR